MKLKPDKVLRDHFFTKESYRHPAKGHLGMWWEILERYTEPRQWVLDPMAGVGATLLGVLMGRNVICMELEQHFITIMKESWEKMRQSPMLGYQLGEAVILRGDARCLPLGRTSCIVTSPPWENQQSFHDKNFNLGGRGPVSKTRSSGAAYTRPTVIVTSPPYENQISDEAARYRLYTVGGCRNEASYTRPVDAVGMSPPYEGVADSTKNTNTNDALRGYPTTPLVYTHPVDTIVTSPPYGEAQEGGDISATMRGEGRYVITTKVPKSVYQPAEHSRDITNIGNLRGKKYWEAMQFVYQEYHRVLQPRGLMVLVLKGFTRDREYIDLPAQTRTLVESLGFRFVEQWQRELWNLSFWRTLQKKQDPRAFDNRLHFEQVLVLEKI